MQTYNIMISGGKVYFQTEKGTPLAEYDILQDFDSSDLLIPLEVLLMIKHMEDKGFSLSSVVTIPTAEKLN